MMDKLVGTVRLGMLNGSVMGQSPVSYRAGPGCIRSHSMWDLW